MSRMPILGLRATDEVILSLGERHGKESQEGEEGNKEEEGQEEVVLKPIHFFCEQ